MIPIAALVRDPNRAERRAKARYRAGDHKRDKAQSEGRIMQGLREANAERFARGWPEISPWMPKPPTLHGCKCHVEQSKPPARRFEVESRACAPPLVVETEAHRVHRAYRLLDQLRPYSRNRTAQCRRYRTSKTIQASTTPDGKSIRLSGLATCGNVWGCPVCSLAIQIRRGGEIDHAIGRWIGDGEDRLGPPTARCYMLTGTLRHAVSHKLAATSQVIADAWSAFFTGREGQEIREQLGVEFTIRALEATYGEEHGWHPHLHIVVFTNQSWSAKQRERVEERWRWAIEQTAGYQRAFRPNEKRGMNIAEVWKKSDGHYLQKMFLELTAPGYKKAGNGNLTYWEVGERAAAGDRRYVHIWQEAQDSLFGRKQLTWSHGAKSFFGIEELADEAIAHEDGIDVTPIADLLQIEIPGEVWDDGWRRDKCFGSKVVAAIRHAAESGDYSSLLALLSRSLARQGGGVACEDEGRELCAPFVVRNTKSVTVAAC